MTIHPGNLDRSPGNLDGSPPCLPLVGWLWHAGNAENNTEYIIQNILIWKGRTRNTDSTSWMDSTGIEPKILALAALCSSQMSYSQGFPSLVSLSLPAVDTPGSIVFTSGFQRLTRSKRATASYSCLSSVGGQLSGGHAQNKSTPTS